MKDVEPLHCPEFVVEQGVVAGECRESSKPRPVDGSYTQLTWPVATKAHPASEAIFAGAIRKGASQ